MHRHLLVKEKNSRNHPHNVADAYHGVGHTEREVLYNIHPQNGCQTVTEPAADELPIKE